MARRVMLAAALALGLTVGSAQAQDDRPTPYWASISAGKAMMRTGPGQNYPATWLYVRADLPIRVVETYPNWRKVSDPEGTTGWMLQRLLSDRRTALVTGDSPRPMHQDPAEDSRVRYLAEPGVVGRISKCSGGWCRIEVGGREGYIRTDHFWGLDPGGMLE
ncbi:MAG TPA: SH3 domain-containing protein [Allosphingosinicella sp.]|nr:SH3 domain-containing protein [Allosphingosinicella sp.]